MAPESKIKVLNHTVFITHKLHPELNKQMDKSKGIL